MADLTAKLDEIWEDLVDSNDDLYEHDRTIASFGKNFLKQINKLKESSTFEKIKKINNEEKQIQGFNEDIDFFRSKQTNLLVRHQENENEKFLVMKYKQNLELKQAMLEDNKSMCLINLKLSEIIRKKVTKVLKWFKNKYEEV